MLAINYLILFCLLGDAVSRRFFGFTSVKHRLAVGFLVGLLISTCFTYLAALLFAATNSPLAWANLLYSVVAVGLILWLSRRVDDSVQPGDGAIGRFFERVRGTDAHSSDLPPPVEDSNIAIHSSPTRIDWDWVILAICFVIGSWLCWETLSYKDGNFEFALKSWSDFGANLSLAQSFALGSNFPTEHPFFPCEPIKYHFLFWFQAANFSFLGMNLVWSVNLLSLMALMALMVLIITFAEILFSSSAVGRISAFLFFFASSSLSYIPFLRSQGGLAEALSSIWERTTYLASGYPFRGDDWGALGVTVFSNQRHLISGVGLLFVVLVFLVDFYKRHGAIVDRTMPGENGPGTTTDGDESEEGKAAGDELIASSSTDSVTDVKPDEPETKTAFVNSDRPASSEIRSMLFAGSLIGALPYWNSAVYVSAAIVLAGIFVLFPFRRQVIYLLGTAAIIGAPQVLMLSSGSVVQEGQSFFYVGYTVAEPTITLVLEYLGWTFGIKWILIALALWFIPGTHRKLFIAVTGLLVAAFLFKFSVDIFNNHKLLNIWNLFALIYASYALWIIGRGGIARLVVASLIALAMTFGAIIDLMPIKNDSNIIVPHENDRLTDWLLNNTQPGDIFLTHTLLSHPILFTGRKLFLGNTLYPWTAGYDVGKKERVYRNMFQQQNFGDLLKLLLENRIAYVAIDDDVRRNKSIAKFNEQTFKQSLEIVFEDTDKKYGNLIIYKVPLSDLDVAVQEQTSQSKASNESSVRNAFDSEHGGDAGQFHNPRGVAVGPDGSFYIADTMNARVQKFAADGRFLAIIKMPAVGIGAMREPNGVAVAPTGELYVTDALTHRLLAFGKDGNFIKAWLGPQKSFFGPRALAFGPRQKLYTLDQGNSRVVVFDPVRESFDEWGRQGIGEGEFAQPTGIAASETHVYVMDALNNRIQVFDPDGRFIAQWPVPEWGSYPWQYPGGAFEAETKRLYVANPRSSEIIVFDVLGNRIEVIRPVGGKDLENPSSLAISRVGNRKVLLIVNTGSSTVISHPLP